MTDASAREPIMPIPELTEWACTLERVAAEPLEFCEDFPTIARRLEAWWAQDCLGRPVLIAGANTDPNRPITRRVELLNDADAWFEAKLTDMVKTHRVAEDLPSVRVDFGAVLLGGLLGGELEFGAGTGWTHAFINDDWSNAPTWTLDEDNRWWKLLCELAERVAADAPGRYLVCTPDLGASADVLLNLRGAGPLCMDVLDKPDLVRNAVDAIYPAWRRAFTELYRITMGQGAGLTHWLQLWSNRPYMIPACDFNYLIGPEQFESIFLPDIARQSATVGRAIFHLDGPGATRHIDALLEVSDIQAIQYVPGAGEPTAMKWVEMFRKIQTKGRSLLVSCEPADVLPLCDALQPEGLAFGTYEETPERLDNLFAELCKRY